MLELKTNALLANFPHFGMIRALVYDTRIANSLKTPCGARQRSGGGMN
jgi:hypothetical protein